MLTLIAILVLVSVCGFAMIHGFSKNRSPQEFTTKSVVIFGASSGIGRALALYYAKRGAKLLLIARQHNLLLLVQNECIAASTHLSSKNSIHIETCDITLEKDISKITQLAPTLFPQIDMVVICSGVMTVLSFLTLLEADTNGKGDSTSTIRKIIDTNTIRLILCSKYFIKELQKTHGHLVVILSLAGVLGAPTRALYASSKFALTGFFNSLCIELGSSFLITLAMPASVSTDLHTSAIDVVSDSSSTSSSP
ncbi:hypothetical protein HK096_010146 [Nowakowskiella sp. JEL0078]|nr:hypothetical protein HK096_010146 [Nowakowskiella sp. JEL0078]